MKQDENSKAMATVDQDVREVMEENFFYLQQITEKIAHRIEVELDGEIKGYDGIVKNLAEALEHIGRLALSYKSSRQKSEDYEGCGECERKG